MKFLKTTLKMGLCLAVVVALTMAVEAPGQVVQQQQQATDDEDVEKVFLPADRAAVKKLSDARRLIAEGRFGEAASYLGAILEGPEDFLFQPNKNTLLYRSLWAEARRLIDQMPREGRQRYELLYGARARWMLDEALKSGDAGRLAEVSRRFFHTRAGCQATFLLGLHHFDHGRPLFGAMVLRRLREGGRAADEFEPALSLTIAVCWLRAGRPEKARQSLVALRKRNPTRRVTIAGREVPLFTDDSKAVEWFLGLIGPQPAPGPAEADGWLMFRGNAARAGQVDKPPYADPSPDGSPPLLSVRWRRDIAAAGDPPVKNVLEDMEKEEKPIIPTLHPLAVGDVLLMRTMRNLLAVDFDTGKRLWETPANDTVKSAPEYEDAEMRIEQRMWRDLTYGTLSSDGHRVYSVNGTQESLCNRLTAHDVRTGKLVWELGGPVGPRQADTFFLGPPLPLMGQLYVLAEILGEVRLLALDAATGKLAWSQPLALPGESILTDLMRRWAGTSPSYADGVLVCPTSTGAVVGVDLATRSLLWGYCYNQNYSGRSNANVRRVGRGIVIVGGGRPVTARDVANAGRPLFCWVDGSILISERRMLVTPVESNWLYCLSLIDGKLLWKCPRQNDLYVACVDEDKVVLVGRRVVRTVRPADGKPAWNGRVVSLPKDGTPSGRGFLVRSAAVPAASGGQDARAPGGGQYFLPLSSAEVICIDLAAGKITQVYKFRKESVPGNLICHRGKIISLGPEGVESYQAHVSSEQSPPAARAREK